MTPLDIELLIHCHICPDPHPRFHAPAVKESLSSMFESGLIELVAEGWNSKTYRTTEKGRAHLENLCSLPYPVLVWAHPYEGQVARP